MDLYHEWLVLILDGGRSQLRDRPRLPKYSGFVLFPEPVGRQFVGVTQPFESVTLYGSNIAEPGQVFDGHGGYEKLPARFRFSSFSDVELRADIERCIREFAYATCEVDADGPEVGEPR